MDLHINHLMNYSTQLFRERILPSQVGQQKKIIVSR